MARVAAAVVMVELTVSLVGLKCLIVRNFLEQLQFVTGGLRLSLCSKSQSIAQGNLGGDFLGLSFYLPLYKRLNN